jgi:hypothetical protein
VRGLWVSRRKSKQQKVRLGYVLGTLASFGTVWTLNVGDLIASRELLGSRISKHGSDDR